MIKSLLFLTLLFGTPAIACTNKDAPSRLNASDIAPLTLIGVAIGLSILLIRRT